MTRKPWIDKDESRRIRAQIRRVLLETWDPIGVAGELYAQDEYDSYIGPIFDLLIAGGTDSDLARYLCWVTNEGMGLTASKSDTLEAIDALRAIAISPASSG